MYLTVQEMTLLCTFHAGTISKTLEMLHNAEDKHLKIMVVVKNLTEKLEVMEEGDSISLYFDSEE